MSAFFPPKHIASTVFLDFNFLSQLAAGETISGATVTVVVYSGADANPSAIISGAATVDVSVVTQRVTGGLVGVTYHLTCTITTSLGATKMMSGFLSVIDSNPYGV